MANLVLQKQGEFWEVYDADAGVTVFSATNQGVAQSFINNGVVNPATVRLYAQQDINYQGGVDTSAGSVNSSQNPQVPAVPTGQVRIYGDSNTTTTITPTPTSIGEGQVRVFGDATNTDVAPTPTRLGEGQVRVFGDAVNNSTDPQAPFIPSEIASGFYDNTPVTESQAQNLQIVQTTVSTPPTPQVSAPDEFGFVADPVTGLNVLAEDVPVDPAGPTQEGLIRLNDGNNLGVPDEFGFVTDPVTGLNRLPEDVPVDQLDGYLTEFTPEGSRVLTPADVEQATAEASARDRARQQQAISSQRRQINNGDWRVRLRLAPQAKYLYNSPNPGILQPLQVTDGVIFPYTPSITTAYKASYSQYDLTHSNYRGYFYQNSNVDPINITATFTAQNTAEANYLLAVITFFKSVTKMFYGQDAERGAPPPLTYLTGLGEYQFNEHPCLVTSFTYNLPADVDYIRAGSLNQLGLNQVNQRDRQSVSTGSTFGGLNRLANALLTKGAIPVLPGPGSLASNRPTYVPTKIEIAISLLPIQSRNQVSKQFSVREFANGNLIKGGFW